MGASVYPFDRAHTVLWGQCVSLFDLFVSVLSHRVFQVVLDSNTTDLHSKLRGRSKLQFRPLKFNLTFPHFPLCAHHIYSDYIVVETLKPSSDRSP